MNKLMLNKGKAMACLILMCLILVQSCRKDSFKAEPHDPTANSEQLIRYEVIDAWLRSNPVARHLQLDWTKAKQTVIKGKNVVIVPVLQLQAVLKQDIGGIKQSSVSGYKIQGKVSSTNAAAQNGEAALQFYVKHPPKVYFIQGNDNSKLYTYLLSFTPKDYNSEAGENKIWTGKLNEYNFSGDTIAIQEIDKNKLVDKYLLKQDAPVEATVYEKIKAEKLQSLSGIKDRKTSNIFYWLLNKVESFIGWVGSAFNASYWAGAQVYGGENYGSGWRISSINWSSIFDSSGNTPQIDYIEPNYTAAGGDVYQSFYGFADPNSEVVYPHGPNVVIQNFVADYVANKFQLDWEGRSFLYTRLDIAEALRAYGEINPIGQEEIDLVKWQVEYNRINNPAVDIEDFKRDYLTKDVGLDTSELGTDGSGQDMNYSTYFDVVDGDFKVISKSDPNYDNVINNGTTSLPNNIFPCTTQALRQIGRDKGWDVGVTPLEFNRRVGQAFQEATFKLYNQKLLPPQRLRVQYQPQNNISIWRTDRVANSGKVIPDWTYDVNFMGVSQGLSQHMFYDAKAVTGFLYLSSSKWQIAGYLDVLSKKKVPNAPPPTMVFVTPINTIISPSILLTATRLGVQVRQAFVMIYNNQLYLLNSIEITPTHDKFTNIPTNMLKILSGPVDLEWPVNPNNGPDFEEAQ